MQLHSAVYQYRLLCLAAKVRREARALAQLGKITFVGQCGKRRLVMSMSAHRSIAGHWPDVAPLETGGRVRPADYARITTPQGPRFRRLHRSWVVPVDAYRIAGNLAYGPRVFPLARLTHPVAALHPHMLFQKLV